MSEPDRTRWEAKHRTARSGPPRASLAWLEQARAGADTGERQIALDLACGQGRHCPALLEIGYVVVAADIARLALQRTTRHCSDFESRVCPVQVDFEDWPFRPDAFDAIVQIDFLARSRFEDIRTSTKPGGYVLIDTFMRGRTSNREGPSNPDYLLRPGELESVFSDWRLVRHQSREEPTARSAILVQRPDRDPR